MYPNTSFITGKGANHRSIKLQPIMEALGQVKTATPPAFHAITGTDNTSIFSRKGKLACWKEFDEVSDGAK